jgi:hypothetical protein
MSNVRAQFPGHTVKRTTVVDEVGNHVRFGWAVVNDATGEPAVTGVDLGVIDQNGRLRSITGFLDQVPVMAERS